MKENVRNNDINFL